MVRARLAVFSLVFICCCGCGKDGSHGGQAPAKPAPAPAMKPAPPTPIAEKKEELGQATWNPAWDAVVEKALPAELLGAAGARAVRPYCPGFAREDEADRRAFWAYTFQAMAGAEAGLNPVSNVRHSAPGAGRKDDVTDRPVREEGLLQLTYEDAERYGCSFDYERDKGLPAKDPNRSILDPEKNLQCGVRILDNQIVAKHEPLVTRSSYWAVLRPGTAGYRNFAKQMANVPEACGVRRGRERRPRR